MPVGGALQQMQMGGQREEEEEAAAATEAHAKHAHIPGRGARSWRGDATPKGEEREEEGE